MHANDPHILAAMDGREPATTVNGSARSRTEPTAFFFPVFGLVYEGLVAASTDASSAQGSRETTIIALEALKSLVHPDYSGKALLEPAIFDEFTSLCYRMAMTESAAVQVHLVEAIAALAINHPLGGVPTLVYNILFTDSVNS